MIKGQLKFVALSALGEHKTTGYALIKHIQASTGCWKPSTGSVYPLLEELYQSGYVTVEPSGKKKIYAITKKGREALDQLCSKRMEFIDQIIDGLKVFGAFHDEKDMGLYTEMLLRLKKGERPLAELQPEMNAFRAELLELYRTGAVVNHSRQIRAILKSTAQSLRKQR